MQTYGVLIDEGAVAATVAVVIGATGFIRTAVPALPTRWIPLLTWLAATILYPIWCGDYNAETIKAGVLAGLSTTGLHAGVRKTVDPDKKLKGKMTAIRKKFGKVSQTNKDL